MRLASSRRSLAALAALLFVLTSGLARGAPLPTGTITGQVLDQTTGRPLRYAGVFLAGTTSGSMTDANGEFRIAGLRPGTYEVRASIVGHAPRSTLGVRVEAGETARLRIVLAQSLDQRVNPVVVHGPRSDYDVHDSEIKHSKTHEQISRLPVENVVDAVGMEAGVVVTDGVLHVEGSYGHQTSTMTNGVASTDPLTGAGLDLSTLSVADYQLINGGLDAEYGNASSVLTYNTRAGGRRFEGILNYRTDDYGRADKTFTNFDQVALGLGGPTQFENLAFYASGEATFQDGEHPPGRTYRQHQYLGGFVTTRDRAAAQYRGQVRLDWKLGSTIKMTGEWTLDRGHSDPYVQTWNVPGATTRIVGFPELQVNPRNPAFWFVTGNRITTYDGPWRARAAQATYYDIRDARDCVYCLLPLSDNSTLRAVRVDDALGRSGRPAYVLADYPLFEGYQRPLSTWGPEATSAPGDSSKRAYNAADHLARTDSRSQQLKWSFTQALSTKTYYEVKLSRLAFDVTTAVANQTPEQYETAGKFLWIPGRGPVAIGNPDFYTDSEYPLFATAYDFPFWSQRQTATYLLRSDLSTLRFANHKVKSGFQLQYADLDQVSIDSPGRQRVFHGPFGLFRDNFHSFAPEGSIYLQDRWEHEGMVVNGGVRYDFFSPGSGVSIDVRNKEIARELDRWQTQWSPRLGLAFPITDRDVFHFHYGRFIQFPPKAYLFDSQDPTWGGTLGNPNLQPETSIAFQAGIKHQWSRDLSTQFALFNKDVYGLVSSTEITDDSTGIQNLRYVNKTYASSRGVELAFNKALSRGFAFDLAYTWGFADGVSSDADFGRQAQGLSHLPTGELPLDWDQRHTFNAAVTLARAGDWAATTVFQYGSGFPWTPAFRFERRADPTLENSRRRPSTHTVDFRGQKYFQLHGHDLRLIFDGKNLLDEAQVVSVAPGAGPAPPDARAAYREYATETGQFGGAFLHDSDGDGFDEFIPVHDPNVYGPRRLFRVGIGIEF